MAKILFLERMYIFIKKIEKNSSNKSFNKENNGKKLTTAEKILETISIIKQIISLI